MRFLEQNQLALRGERLLKKMLSKRLNTRRFFFSIGSNNYFTVIENKFQVFTISFKFNITVYNIAYVKRHTVVTPSKRKKPNGLSSSAAKVKYVTHIIVIMAQQRPYMKDVNVS